VVKVTFEVLSLDNRAKDGGIVNTSKVTGFDIGRESIMIEEAKRGRRRSRGSSRRTRRTGGSNKLCSKGGCVSVGGSTEGKRSDDFVDNDIAKKRHKVVVRANCSARGGVDKEGCWVIHRRCVEDVELTRSIGVVVRVIAEADPEVKDGGEVSHGGREKVWIQGKISRKLGIRSIEL
jgi:hypothetical protein